MTMPHVLDRLPLWIEGDLEAADMAAVDRHLSQCPACQEAAEGLRASQAWVRESTTSPFDAADHGHLRRQVMGRIRAEARPIRRLHLRPALMAAAALLLAVLVWQQPGGREGTPLPSDPLPSPLEVPPSSARAARPEPPPPATSLPHPRGRPASKADLESPPQSEPTRIEFQTADPTIRIIWLAQAKPLPATEPLPEEP